MALPDTAVVQVGTQIVFANTAEHSPSTNNNLGTRTDQIDLGGTVGTLTARQSDQVDLGASRAFGYSVVAAIEFATAPADGDTVDFYWAPSNNATAAVANPGGVSGADGAYTGTAGSTITESLAQCMYIGSLSCTNDATTTVQIGYIGSFMPPERYGTLVVYNNTGVSYHSDAVEMSVSLTPMSYVVID